MPKKIKLNLNDLKVQSFVTALDDKDKKKIEGGGSSGCTGPDEDCTFCSQDTACNSCRPSVCSGTVACC